MKERFRLKKATVVIIIIALSFLGVVTGNGLAQDVLAPNADLGKFLYFDENLSEPAGQSCASCHDPDFGFADPDRYLPVSEGVIRGLFGGRNSPSSAYAMYAPWFDDGEWIGGQFWDGRATGKTLEDPLADQALGPFLNGVEMANESKWEVVRDAQDSEYGKLFISSCTPNKEALKEGDLNIEDAYDCIAESIAAFERTALFAQFSSKYDYYLSKCIANGGILDDCAKGNGRVAARVGRKIFSWMEWKGFQLFMNDNNNNDGIKQPGEGAMCVACHTADFTDPLDINLYPNPVVVPDWSKGMVPPLFTDFTYDNLGVPKSKHRLLRNNPDDLGLGGEPMKIKGANGLFKVMTLRGIADTRPYAHNGYFRTLWGIVHFYNTRDVKNWPAPEVAENVNGDELGKLGLKYIDEVALVAFMRTLSDGWNP